MTTTAPPQKKQLKVLHVGVSNRGEWPLKHCDATTGFLPAALCDTNSQALAQAAEKTGLPSSVCFTDYNQALRNTDVDCVIICAPTVLHVPLVKKAIATGLPVLVEKGMAPDWKSACDLVQTAQAAGVVVAVAQNYRYFAIERTIWRAIHDPTFPAFVGPVHLIVYTHNRVRPVPGTLTYPFASIWDMSCHHFDNMMYWLGPVAEMTSHSWGPRWSPYEHHNNTTAHIVFASGTHAHYIHTHDAARLSLEIQIHGQRGALFRQGNVLNFSLRPLEQFGTSPVSTVQLEEANGESDLLRDFHSYITEGKEPGISARNNLQTMAACEMMVRSITAKKTCHRWELT